MHAFAESHAPSSRLGFRSRHRSLLPVWRSFGAAHEQENEQANYVTRGSPAAGSPDLGTGGPNTSDLRSRLLV